MISNVITILIRKDALLKWDILLSSDHCLMRTIHKQKYDTIINEKKRDNLFHVVILVTLQKYWYHLNIHRKLFTFQTFGPITHICPHFNSLRIRTASHSLFPRFIHIFIPEQKFLPNSWEWKDSGNPD